MEPFHESLSGKDVLTHVRNCLNTYPALKTQTIQSVTRSLAVNNANFDDEFCQFFKRSTRRQFEHTLKCCGDVLTQVVEEVTTSIQESLGKETGDIGANLIERIYNIVLFIHNYDHLKTRFSEELKAFYGRKNPDVPLGDSRKMAFPLANKAQWDSILAMLTKFSEFKEPLVNLCNVTDIDTGAVKDIFLNNQEWVLLDEIIAILKPVERHYSFMIGRDILTTPQGFLSLKLVYAGLDDRISGYTEKSRQTPGNVS